MKIEILVNRNFPTIFHDKSTYVHTRRILSLCVLFATYLPQTRTVLFTTLFLMDVYIFLIAAVCNNNNFNKSYQNLPSLLCARSFGSITYSLREWCKRVSTCVCEYVALLAHLAYFVNASEWCTEIERFAHSFIIRFDGTEEHDDEEEKIWSKRKFW